MNIRLLPTDHFKGEVRVPGDKSISHRALIFATLATGRCVIKGLLRGKDVLNTLKALQLLGASIEDDGNDLHIAGAGMQGLKTEQLTTIDMGNSGTSIRILAGLLCAQHVDVALVGDQYLAKRPMERVIDPLQKMGANVDSNVGYLPVRIKPPPKGLMGIEYTMPVPSAQIKSSILMAGLYAKGKTVVHSPAPCRDHTERMLETFGYFLEFDSKHVCLEGGGNLVSPERIQVPSDLSSAAFFIVGALIKPNASVRIPNVGVNETRSGLLKLLDRMGAKIALKNQRFFGSEPVADIEVSYSRLNGIVIDADDVALAIDEIPVILVAAACASGVTVLKGAGELRVKESDRLKAMCEGLLSFGVELTETSDGAVITGGQFRKPSQLINSFGDHRIAMSFIIASLCVSGEVMVTDCANISTSFPNFAPQCQALGMSLVMV